MPVPDGGTRTDRVPGCRDWQPPRSVWITAPSMSVSERGALRKCCATSVSGFKKKSRHGGMDWSNRFAPVRVRDRSPRYVPERGEIVMTYRQGVTRSSSGRGLQQTLLLLAYMYANPGAVLLLDEPDGTWRFFASGRSSAHRHDGSQIIAASSEVLLNGGWTGRRRGLRASTTVAPGRRCGISATSTTRNRPAGCSTCDRPVDPPRPGGSDTNARWRRLRLSETSRVPFRAGLREALASRLPFSIAVQQRDIGSSV